MNAYLLPAIVLCGSCGNRLLPVDKTANPVRNNGVIQVICPHAECADYDRPMEFDLPCVELRPTSDAAILSEQRAMQNRKAIQLLTPRSTLDLQLDEHARA